MKMSCDLSQSSQSPGCDGLVAGRSICLLPFVATALLATALLATAALSDVRAATFYIAPNGCDEHAGTIDQPFATPHRARDAIRTLGREGEPVRVIFREGTYYLADTLRLTPEDSGTAAAPVIWQSASGEHVVLSGGRLIAGRWRTDDGRIWHVDVPEAANPWRSFKTVDYEHAEVVGRWTTSSYTGPTYLHDDNTDKGRKEVRFPIRDIEPGTYRITLLNTAHFNRATSVPVTLKLEGSEKVVRVNQRQSHEIVLGQWEFTSRNPGTITVSNDGAEDGYVIAYGIRLDKLTGGRPEAWKFRQLFVSGNRAIRARYPNADAEDPFLYAAGGNVREGIFRLRMDPQRVKGTWGREKDAQINIVPDWRFFNQWNDVVGVDTAAGELHLGEREQHARGFRNGDWFWIEGVRCELDAENEWYLDSEAGRLSYLPPEGKDPNRMDIVAPYLNRIIDIRGDVEASTHVEHVHFQGLHFKHTTFTLGHIEARVHTDAAVKLVNAAHCRIERCAFENIGGYALWLHLDSRHNVIDRNRVVDAGAGGVLMTGARLSYMDDTKVYTPGEAAAQGAPLLNEVTRNCVERCGQIRYYGGGVHIDSRPDAMAMLPGNYIAHNHFRNLSRNGIFLFRNQGGTVIEYNHIHDCMQTTIDGAAIHLATMNRVAAPNYILSNYLYDIWGFEQTGNGPRRRLGNGIFLDWCTSHTTVKHNYIYNSVDGAIKTIFENVNLTIADNHAAEERMEPPFLDQLGPGGTLSAGVRPQDLGLVGGVIHYSEDNLVALKGPWAPRLETGMWGLFRFQYLTAARDAPAEITFRLPIREAGKYAVSLRYLPRGHHASNAAVRVEYAAGDDVQTWNLQRGHRHGFDVKIGEYHFDPDRPATVTISNPGADGVVVADSVSYVKMPADDPIQHLPPPAQQERRPQ
jgi:hypothetical protein